MTTTILRLIDDPLSTECYSVRLFLSHQNIAFQSDYSSLDALNHQLSSVTLIHGTQTTHGVLPSLCYLAEHCILTQSLTKLTTKQLSRWQQLQLQLQQSLGCLRQANLGFDYFIEAEQSIALQANHQLSWLNDQLCRQSVSKQSWLNCGTATSLADFLIFPLVALSSDSGVSTDDFVHIQRWLQRMQQISGYIAMPGLLYS